MSLDAAKTQIDKAISFMEAVTDKTPEEDEAVAELKRIRVEMDGEFDVHEMQFRLTKCKAVIETVQKRWSFS